ncbi:MAG: MotA/TolQ/ExbB proton channel family protein [Pirellulales bacterium]|nr:MotA/TolQ/ExbB proton channel family protein [Pirellulales bacterium]
MPRHRKSVSRLLTAGASLVVASVVFGLALHGGTTAAWAQSAAGSSAFGTPGDAAPQLETPSEVKATPVADEAPIPTKNLWSIIRSGGLLMIPLGICSLILMAFVFERAISLRRGRVIPRPFVRRFLEQMRGGELDRDAALQLCEESGSPVSEVFAGAVRKWARPAVEVEQGIIDAGERVTNSLRRYLRVLNAIATISPLLGLLGTVVGMISAFNAIATSDAMGRPELLATGISQALLTTAAGLSIAIPALIVYLFFASRVDRLIMDIDGLGQELVPLVSAEEMGSRPKNAARTPAGSKSRSKTERPAAA